jgi:hypothetical protein
VVQARRAKVRPLRLIIPLAVAAALLVGGSFAAWKFWPDETTAGPQAESSTTAAESQAPTTAESSPSPTQLPSAAAASAAAQEALAACQQRVQAADKVIKQGTTGVQHWAIHIQAQKDNLAGKITVEQMKAKFKATRLKGPADLDGYNEALSAYKDLEGSCGKVEGADSAVAATLAKCAKRSKAQPAVLQAVAAGMKDWKNHQKFMQQNALHRAGTPKEAQAAWLKQYYAAPKNIKAFKTAVRNFDAPSC